MDNPLHILLRPVLQTVGPHLAARFSVLSPFLSGHVVYPLHSGSSKWEAECKRNLPGVADLMQIVAFPLSVGLPLADRVVVHGAESGFVHLRSEYLKRHEAEVVAGRYR